MGTYKNKMQNIQKTPTVGIFIVLFSLLLFACDDAGGNADESTGDSANNEARAELEDGYCSAFCAEQTCEGNNDANCQEDCLQETASVLSTDYLEATRVCLEDYTCESDNSCLSTALTELLSGVDLPSDPVYLQCVTQSAICGFSDGICITYYILANEPQNALQGCFDLSSCADMNQCIDDVQDGSF